MVARILHPDLRVVFPDRQHLPNVQDAAYFAIALDTMPSGMLGLLISGIFASTMGQLEPGLNRNAGYFIKNFYQVKVRPHASERELLLASRLVTILFGLLIILATLWFASLEDMPIFKLMVNFGGWVALPIAVPLIWGMFIRSAPSWAGWTTVLIGLGTSLLVNQVMTGHWAGEIFGWTLNKRESSDWAQAAGIMMNIVVASVWFLLTPLLSRRVAADERQRVDQFFAEMRTPVDFAREEGGPGSDNVQAGVMGLLCLIYGGFITLLAVIPNPPTGRVAFLFCGGVMFGVGVLLRRAAKPRRVGPLDTPVVATSAPRRASPAAASRPVE
jgi:hypothetical protein